jgi:hypothetical protein
MGETLSMITVCAWCERYLGSSGEPVTHGICPACTSRQYWRDSPVLVVSRHRQEMAPVLLRLLKGSPEVRVIVERRGDDRRRRRETDGPGVERRSGQDRRRGDDLILI